MGMYFDDLIAYKSLYLLMQKKTSRNLDDELNDLRKAAEERCGKCGQYSLVQAKEKVEETSLTPITEEIRILRNIKNILGHVRMFFNKKQCSGESLCPPEETQQEAMAKLLMDSYEKVIVAPAQIKEILGRDTVMKILGMDINEFIKENNKQRGKGKSRETNILAIEH
jgi:hypothetical protein